jgi:CRP-like cAMP-binding protein
MLKKHNSLERMRAFFNQVLVAPIPSQEWEAFVPGVHEQIVAKGQSFAKIGGTSHEVGFVIEGLLKIYYLDFDGKVAIRNFCAEDSLVCPYSSVLSGTPSNVEIEAVEPSKLLVFKYSHISKGFGRHACWEELGRKIAETNYILRERREYQLLTQDAATRYASFQSDFKALHGRLTQNDIASYLGISYVSLSRIINS